jgi:urea transport system substrate-binding protein
LVSRDVVLLQRPWQVRLVVSWQIKRLPKGDRRMFTRKVIGVRFKAVTVTLLLLILAGYVSMHVAAQELATSVKKQDRLAVVREITKLSAEAFAANAIVGPTAPTAHKANAVKVGILHSLSGNLALTEKDVKDAELLAIDEINQASGVLGRKIEAIVEDAQSNFTTTFPEKAKKLLVKDKVAVVFGCYTSVSRHFVTPHFEENNGLLFFPANYEGNTSSKNVVYTGAVPNQQVLPAIQWMLEEKKYKKIYLIGTDYVYPRTANFIIKKHLKAKNLEPVAESYVPFGNQEFEKIVQDIKQKQPDVIVSMINGDSNVNFFNELAAQRITAEKTPVVSFFIGEDELRGLDPDKLKGHYTAACYFQSLDTPKNKEFVKKFKAKYGEDRVTNDAIAAAYAQVYLWKLTVEKAKSFDVDKVRMALRAGITYDAPEGKIGIDPKTQHTLRYFRMGKVRDDRQFEIVQQSKVWIAPEPYPQIAFPGWSCDWTKGGVVRGK